MPLNAWVHRPNRGVVLSTAVDASAGRFLVLLADAITRRPRCRDIIAHGKAVKPSALHSHHHASTHYAEGDG
jgi:hypothetical protein